MTTKTPTTLPSPEATTGNGEAQQTRCGANANIRVASRTKTRHSHCGEPEGGSRGQTNTKGNEMTMTTAQFEIRELKKGSLLPDERRFRIVAEPEAFEWQRAWERNGSKEPWCELSIHAERYSNGTATGRFIVTCYGGELWPSAWPSLFKSVHEYGSLIVVTKHGVNLLSLNAQ